MATRKQELVIGKLVEYSGSGKPFTWGGILVEAGYSPKTALTPTKVTKSKGFQELLEENLPDELLQKIHLETLAAKGMEHQVFPLSMKDEEIIELIEKFGGTVQKFKHGETATHVWYFIADHKMRLDAVKLGYTVKGQITKNDRVPDAPTGNTYNTFIGNNTINPNTPKAKELADETLRILMEKTKRPVAQNTTQND